MSLSSFFLRFAQNRSVSARPSRLGSIKEGVRNVHTSFVNGQEFRSHSTFIIQPILSLVILFIKQYELSHIPQSKH